jgi:hypothetical protein
MLFRELKVAVENVPGLKAIHDHVVWVEPNSGMVFASPEDENARVSRVATITTRDARCAILIGPIIERVVTPQILS